MYNNWSYYQWVKWFFLLPVLLPLVLLGRRYRRNKERLLLECKPDAIGELSLIYDRAAETREYDEGREDKIDPKRWSADYLGWKQDDGTYISEYSIQFTWCGEQLHDLVPGRVYNIVKAIECGKWANGRSCLIPWQLKKAILSEAQRRKVMVNAEKHEDRNSNYSKDVFNAKSV